jgi:MOSC domain-containing protein YiiM
VAVDPTQPNLRQVHLLQAELLQELAGRGLAVAPGQMGENISTLGLDLLSLPVGTRLLIGADAVLELTGLRNPCAQIENFLPGLLAAVLDRGPQGQLIRKAGVMAIVIVGGRVAAADKIEVRLPAGEQRPLERV